MNRSGELTLFCYPWDALDTGPHSLAGDVAALGVDRLAVAVAYHSADIVYPRRRRAVVHQAEANALHLPLPSPGTTPWPRSSSLVHEQPRLFPELADGAAARGLKLTAWTVALHNSTLAAEHPELAPQNCFGDRGGHSLCPAAPAVRDYAVALVDSVAATGLFDEVLVESPGYLPVGHGHPHELWAVRLDPLGRTLLSLCFCAACVELGASAGIDVAALRGRVADRLTNRWNSTSAGLRSPDEGLEIAALLLEDPELAHFLRRRCDVVTELLRSATDAAHGHGARLATAGPIWARPLAYGWLEGLLPAPTTEVVDRLYLLAYHDQVPGVARDVDVAVGAAGPENYAMVQTLWPDQHGGSPDVLAAKVRVALEAGITSIGLYNFATAPAPALQWIPAIAELVHAAGHSGEATRSRVIRT